MTFIEKALFCFIVSATVAVITITIVFIKSTL